MKKKTNMIKPYTHQTNVTRRKYYIDKRCINMGGSTIVKEPNEKKSFLSKDQSSKIGYSKQ